MTQADSELDPIFSAIDAHKEATRNTDTAYAKVLSEPIGEGDTAPLGDAIVAEYRAIDAMVTTSPTTRAGLHILADHLRGDRQHNVPLHIRRPLPTDSGFASYGGPDGVEWLIARRAAEISAAA